MAIFTGQEGVTDWRLPGVDYDAIQEQVQSAIAAPEPEPVEVDFIVPGPPAVDVLGHFQVGDHLFRFGNILYDRITGEITFL